MAVTRGRTKPENPTVFLDKRRHVHRQQSLIEKLELLGGAVLRVDLVLCGGVLDRAGEPKAGELAAGVGQAANIAAHRRQ